ncbi:cytidine deaminase [Roseibium alexandrii]|jgi:cytidine deaminase|uniref:Cytidine deaminase n=2 Tax=Roseibium alexandrii TaxID=388408 RepID=A0A0M6ZR59_9HYPH|nr:cytidine deaminase [Roseibium alexandrii]EEE42897.1 cytidine deaminase, homotetrameric [Roseibium alexandrii DFL-11]CTQ65255.1 Cytidine deaminase [Roseibium alexandrii]
MSDLDKLFEAAKAVREKAYAPYSNFLVGAAFRTPDGAIFTGCNVENASYPVSVCAEGGAASAMIAAGYREIEEAVVIGDAALCTPCGMCRQRFAEFGTENLVVHVADLDGIRRSFTLDELLPAAFELEDKKD